MPVLRIFINTACCGEIDICGFKKTRSYYRDILWDNGTELHIAVRQPLNDGEVFKLSGWGWPTAKSSWTWPGCERSWNCQAMHVDVYSACDEVELRLAPDFWSPRLRVAMPQPGSRSEAAFGPLLDQARSVTDLADLIDAAGAAAPQTDPSNPIEDPLGSHESAN